MAATTARGRAKPLLEAFGALAIIAAAAAVLGEAGARVARASPVILASYATAGAFSLIDAAALVAARRLRRTTKGDLEEPLLGEDGATEKSNVQGFRRLLRQSRPEWPAMAGATVALTLAVLGQTLQPVIFGHMIDALASDGSRKERLRKYSLACVDQACVVALGCVFTAIRARATARRSCPLLSFKRTTPAVQRCDRKRTSSL